MTSLHVGVELDEESRTTSMGLWTDGKQMLAAAKLLATGTDSRLAISSPTYYLIGHGLEVLFKAFLRANGLSLMQLRKIGHNLVKAADRSTKFDLAQYCAFSGDDCSALRLLNVYYKRKYFEYRVNGSKQLVEPAFLIALGDRLCTAIQPFCLAHMHDFDSSK